jgi:hypothetical protein
LITGWTVFIAQATSPAPYDEGVIDISVMIVKIGESDTVLQIDPAKKFPAPAVPGRHKLDKSYETRDLPSEMGNGAA